MTKPHLILLYHFFHPDEVISARLFSDLAVHMERAGWQVLAMPAARLYASDAALPREEDWKGVHIRRVWRPAWKQASNVGRMLNALLLLLAWTWRAVVTRRRAREVVVVGTDPVLSILVAIPWRLFRPRCRIVHWCHDVHPEASVAEGALTPGSLIVRGLKFLLARAYRRCDLIVDLGSCMRQLLLQYQPNSQHDTIEPWALVEPETVNPPQANVHQALFQRKTLGCLYSGNLGRAHEFELFLKLSRAAQESDIAFCFAGRGARMQALKDALTQADTNVHLAGFADETQLHARLAAADVHLVSLRDNWTGTVVPSKFFGALAIGRPVLFVGSQECTIAKWIQQESIGWHLTEANLLEVLADLKQLADNPERRLMLNRHCLAVYQKRFSKAHQLKRWSHLLTQLCL